MFGEYRPLFDGVGTGPGDKTLEDKLYEYEVFLYLSIFMDFLGKNQYKRIHDAVSIWLILFLVEIEGARVSKYCMDL